MKHPAKTALAAALLSLGLAQHALAGNLIVSRTVYAGTASTVALGQALPGGGNAIANGSFPNVFKNETPDPSFGVTSPIYLDQLATNGAYVGTLSINPAQLVTSFASKSELALNLAADGHSLTFMGYAAPQNTLDVSNSNTAAVFDSTNPVGSTFPRAVANVNLGNGSVQATSVNAYSGNNGRAAVLANGQYYMVGNAGNGSAAAAGLCALSDNTGVQRIAADSTGNTTPVGAKTQANCTTNGYQRGFSITQVGYSADKTGKDDNFRGMAVFNNTLYVTKGSGSNGVNTVYQVGAANALASNGVIDNAAITILPGFSTLSEKLAETAPTIPTPHPFGLWFADANTLFVADEGDGVRLNVAGKVATFAGLQEWTLSGGTWTKVQTFQKGLIDQAAATPNGLAWKVQADGLRNITGQHNADGTVTIFGTTSTVSDETTHDLGADPNQIVAITVGSGSTAANTAFTVLRTAVAGQRFGGVALSASNTSLSGFVNLGGYVLNRGLNKFTQQVTLTNNSTSPITGPVNLALDNLSGNTALANSSGATANHAPLGSPYYTLSVGDVPAGGSVSATLQFNKPASGGISYIPRAITGSTAP